MAKPKAPNTNKLARQVKPQQVLETKAGKQQLVQVVGELSKRQAPHFAQFAEDVIHQWGGSQRFAQALKEMYDETSSLPLKSQIMRSVMRMVERNTAMGGSEDDFNSMSDEDLENQAVHLLKKMYGDGRVFNNTIENLGPKRRYGPRERTAAQDAGGAGRAAAGSSEAVRTTGQPEGVSHERSPGTSPERQQPGRQDDAGGD